MEAGARTEARPYRLDVRLPRELSEKLDKLHRLANSGDGKRVSKNDLVVQIIRRFFEDGLS